MAMLLQGPQIPPLSSCHDILASSRFVSNPAITRISLGRGPPVGFPLSREPSTGWQELNRPLDNASSQCPACPGFSFDQWSQSWYGSTVPDRTFLHLINKSPRLINYTVANAAAAADRRIPATSDLRHLEKSGSSHRTVNTPLAICQLMLGPPLSLAHALERHTHTHTHTHTSHYVTQQFVIVLTKGQSSAELPANAVPPFLAPSTPGKLSPQGGRHGSIVQDRGGMCPRLCTGLPMPNGALRFED
ncbi:hypothetical protein EV126DRAFT_209311 [Verticillium dahliae]|nr:hypothetical protein EV126DRAFT_209311 [Verticillium dahliae]